MTRSELVNHLADRCDLPRAQADEIVRLIFDRIRDKLTEGGRVEIRGFGSFKVKSYPGHRGRHPRKRDVILEVPPKVLPVFRVGRELKELIDLPHNEE